MVTEYRTTMSWNGVVHIIDRGERTFCGKVVAKGPTPLWVNAVVCGICQNRVLRRPR